MTNVAEVEVEKETIKNSIKEPVRPSIEILSGRESFIEASLTNDQKEVMVLLENKNILKSQQAPSVDSSMILQLGNPVNKTKLKSEGKATHWKVKYQNGTEFEGPIDENPQSKDFEQPITFGKFKFPNGDIYEGMIGIRGTGKYIHKDGTRYEGQFYKLGKSGNGVETYPNGDVYTGMFKRNMKNGKGQTKYTNGDSFDGNYVNGLRKHIGEYRYKDGDKVVGDWHDDNLHGKGQVDLKSGSKIKSNFSLSKFKH